MKPGAADMVKRGTDQATGWNQYRAGGFAKGFALAVADVEKITGILERAWF